MKIKINNEIVQNINDIDLGGGVLLSNLISNILLQAHLIGSYYWSDSPTNPATLFGGTWTQIKDKFVIAVGDSHVAGKTYGSNTKNLSHIHNYAHTHSVPGVAHNHGLGGGWANIGSPNSNSMALGFSALSWHGAASTYSVGGNSDHAAGHPNRSHDTSLGGNTDNTTPTATTINSQSTSTTGSGLSATFDITPACEAAYCWKRTA